MATFTVQDVVSRMGDWLSNYSTGQITTTAQIRAVDYAVNVIKRALGFPQDEKKYQFWYSADTFFYSTPSDMQDPIGLYYDVNSENIPRYGQKWEYRPYVELMSRTGNYPATPNMYSITTVNGSTQLMLLGSNVQAGSVLDTMSVVNNWVVADGASGLIVDANNYPSNFDLTGQSLTFTGAAYATNPASSLVNSTVNYSIPNMISDDTFFELYIMTSNANVSSYTLKLYTDASNYYTITTTTDYTGSAFVASLFQKIQWQSSNAVITGTPNSLNITKVEITANVNSSYTGGTFWFNYLTYLYPDYMDFYYYSTIKGTNASGTAITKLTSLTDQFSYDYDFIEPIALKAAYYLMPTLRADLQFMQAYKADYMEFLQLYSRSHPKIRTRNDRTRTRLSR